MAKRYDVVVVGAGVVGLLLAVLTIVRSRGTVSLAICDRAQPPAWPEPPLSTLRVSALSPATIGLLEEAGVWHEKLSLNAAPYQHMRVWDSAGTPDAAGSVHFSADQLDVPALGWIVENEAVRSALNERLFELGGETLFSEGLVSVDFRSRYVKAELASGISLEARLLVGADGANSRVRSLAKIDYLVRDYQQHAVVLHVTSEHAHQATAWQQFNTDGPLALLPLADGRSSVVYSTTKEQAALCRSMSENALTTLLDERSGRALGRLKKASALASFPLAAGLTSAYAIERCALAGDAAHRVHPLAGQGVNLGAADADSLAARICQSLADGQDPGDLRQLETYQRARRTHSQSVLGALDLIHRTFSMSSNPAQVVRRSGMALFDRSGLIKRGTARLAMGL